MNCFFFSILVSKICSINAKETLDKYHILKSIKFHRYFSLYPERRAIAQAHASTRLKSFRRARIYMCKQMLKDPIARVK